MSQLFLLIVLLGNLWIWKILAFNIFLALLVAVTSISLYLLVQRKSQKLTAAFSILFLVLLFFQLHTTFVQNLTYLDNDQQRLQQERLRQYPPQLLRIGYWFEGRNESIAFFRVRENFFEALDPNLYFFANHPRQRVGVKELEKFPYLFLPFFIFGIFKLADRKTNKVFYSSFFLPVFLTSFIGSDNPLSSFSLFPFFVVSIFRGVEGLYKVYIKKDKVISFMIVGIIFFLLVLIQVFTYETY